MNGTRAVIPEAASTSPHVMTPEDTHMSMHTYMYTDIHTKVIYNSNISV